jgi:PKD repeat protein
VLHRNVAAPLALVVLALSAPEARADGPLCGTDAFSGAALDGNRWSVLRPAQDGPAVADGRLRLPLGDGALAGSDATARNVVLQQAPTGGWTATTRVGVAAVDEAGERAGLVLWRSEGAGENAFATATFTRSSAGAPRFEAVYTDGSVPAIPLARSGVDAPAGLSEVMLRLRSDGNQVRAAYSGDDGASWTGFGEAARMGGPVRVGALALGTAGTASFDDFTLSCGPEIALHSEPERGTATAEMGINAMLSDDRDDQFALQLAWDFGDGTTGEGSQARFHKYTTPGTYRPTLRATDSDGNVTAASRTITVLATESPCPAWSDEFAGNGLDPRWQVRRPVPTGLDVHDGRLWLHPYAGELPAAARNVVLQPAPAGPWTMTTAVDLAALDAPGDRAGLVLWRGDGTGESATLLADGAGAAPSGTAHLRIVSSGTRPATFTALRSADGEHWTPAGDPFTVGGAGQLELGVVALGTSVSEPAGFDHVRVEGGQPCGAPDVTPPETTHTLDRQPDGAVRVTLAAVDDATGSGVARTEYRVGAGAFVPYDAPFTLTAPGEHLVEYRSLDRAGNAEPAQPLRIAIAGAPPAEGTGEPGPGAIVPRGVTDRQPTVRPMVRITAPKRLRAARLARRGVRVVVACRGVASVRVTLAVRSRVARRLGLGRRTLAGRVVRCGAVLDVRLAPRGRARRIVRRAARPFAVTIEARAAGVPRDRLRVTVA